MAAWIEVVFLFSVAAIWTIAVLTPGPNLLAVLGVSARFGRLPALAAAIGVCTGTFVWGLAGWLGISTLFSAAPALYALLKALGAGYLIWMGLNALIRAWKNDRPRTARITTSVGGMRAAFVRGVSTNLSNPKTAIFVSSLFAATVPPDTGWQFGLATIALMVSISLAWYAAMAFFFTIGVVANALGTIRRGIDAVAGTIFVAFGLHLAFSDQS